MKKMFYIMSIVLGVFMLGFTMTGCGLSKAAKAEEVEKKPAVCFVIGATANAQAPNFNSPLIQDTVLDCARNYGFVAVVNADGCSEVVAAESLDIDEKYKQASSERLEMDARSKADSILRFMKNVKADDPEVDYLEALRLACRTLASLEGYTSKTIVALGTGFSTIGYMSYHNNLICVQPETVVSLLNEKKAVPNFSGINGVYWQGMGDVAAPQQSLSPAQHINVQDTWKELIACGGSELILNEFISSQADESAAYPVVSVVDLPAETPISFDVNEFSNNDEVSFETPVVLGEEQIEFVADKAEYLYPDKAADILAPIAAYMSQHEEVTLLLAGTTAGDEDSDYTFQLSKNRADAVKDTLVDLGVEKGRILTVGLGSSDPWHVPGAGYKGSIASGNRKVVVMDASSDIAKQLMTN